MDKHGLVHASDTPVGRGSPAGLNDDEVGQTAGDSTGSQRDQAAAIDGAEAVRDQKELGCVGEEGSGER